MALFGGMIESPTAAGTSNARSYYSDPGLAQQLLQMVMGQQGQMTNYLQNPTASPLYQNQLSGLLSALAPSEQQAMTNLGDTFRGAGMMSSGIYANAANRLQGDLLRNRQELASKLLGQSFSQMNQALLGQMGLTPQLLSAMKLEERTANSNSAGGGSSAFGGGNITSQGLNTPMYGSATNTRTPAAVTTPTSQWNGMDDSAWYQQRQQDWDASQALNNAIIDNYNKTYGQMGSTTFMPGGQYVSVGNNDGSSPAYNPYAAGQNTFSPWEGSLLTQPQG